MGNGTHVRMCVCVCGLEYTTEDFLKFFVKHKIWEGVVCIKRANCQAITDYNGCGHVRVLVARAALTVHCVGGSCNTQYTLYIATIHYYTSPLVYILSVGHCVFMITNFIGIKTQHDYKTT